MRRGRGGWWDGMGWDGGERGRESRGEGGKEGREGGKEGRGSEEGVVR